MSTTSSKKITLKSSDEETFEVDAAVACESKVIKNIIEYDSSCVESVIPLPNVTGKILAKVIEYCKKHVEAASKTDENNTAAAAAAAAYEELKAWDASFMMVDQDTIFDLIMAANFLDIKGLFELTAQTVVDMMKGKTAEEIKKIFIIENDFTPEEEEEIRMENQWAVYPQ